jgi:DNA replication protein DnaC
MPSTKTKKKKSKPTPIPSHDLEKTMSLEQVLDALGLDRAAELFDTATQKAITRNDSPTKLLDYLMREQLRVHVERRAERALKRSRIFPLCTLDTFDFDYPKQIDRELVMRAASLEFIEDKTNCVFVGPSGVGKTHLANAIGQLACLRGYKVRFTLAADLVNDLVAGQTRNTLQRRLATWTAPDLVIIDELGYLSFDSRGADLLYQVFNRRYLRSSTIVTTNLAFTNWGNLFHNAAAASAIADRLVHKGLLVSIAGKSRRSDREVPM